MAHDDEAYAPLPTEDDDVEGDRTGDTSRGSADESDDARSRRSTARDRSTASAYEKARAVGRNALVPVLALVAAHVLYRKFVRGRRAKKRAAAAGADDAVGAPAGQVDQLDLSAARAGSDSGADQVRERAPGAGSAAAAAVPSAETASSGASATAAAPAAGKPTPSANQQQQQQQQKEPADEKVIVVDENNKEMGIAARTAMRKSNLWHRATYVLVLTPDGSRLHVQKRTNSKDVYPGMYDAAAGGVVIASETYAESAARELREEMGLVLPLERVCALRYEGDRSRVHGEVFTCTYDAEYNAQRIVPQAEEVAAVELLTLDQVLDGSRDFTPDTLLAVQQFMQSRIVTVEPASDSAGGDSDNVAPSGGEASAAAEAVNGANRTSTTKASLPPPAPTAAPTRDAQPSRPAAARRRTRKRTDVKPRPQTAPAGEFFKRLNPSSNEARAFFKNLNPATWGKSGSNTGTSTSSNASASSSTRASRDQPRAQQARAAPRDAAQ